MSNTEEMPRVTSFPDAPEDFGLYIGADGVNPSVPWILKDHGKTGVFTEAAIQQILDSGRPTFRLTAEDLRALSRSLGIVLNPEALPFLHGVSRSHARKLGSQQLDSAAKHIRKGEKEALSAVDALEQLAATSFGERGPLPLSDVERKVAAAGELLRDAAKALRAIASSATVYTARFENRRHVPDVRRGHVVFNARRFLEETGNPYGFTTDVHTNKRGGALMEFLDIIVPHLTDPASRLSRDTVAKDIRSLKNMKQDLCTEGE